jgi:hypothetical protein
MVCLYNLFQMIMCMYCFQNGMNTDSSLTVREAAFDGISQWVHSSMYLTELLEIFWYLGLCILRHNSEINNSVSYTWWDSFIHFRHLLLPTGSSVSCVVDGGCLAPGRHIVAKFPLKDYDTRNRFKVWTWTEQLELVLTTEQTESYLALFVNTRVICVRSCLFWCLADLFPHDVC